LQKCRADKKLKIVQKQFVIEADAFQIKKDWGTAGRARVLFSLQ
jgi:hypothetical protein